MSDDTQNVDAGSETSGEQAVDTTVAAQADTAETTATDTSATETATAATDASAVAGGAAQETQTAAATDAEQSRTGYADTGLRAGDECVCPDGRKGTVYSFDAGLICIPNHDQG